MKKLPSRALLAAAVLLGAETLALAKETPVGAPQIIGGMEVGAVYLQPIEMDPPGMMLPVKESDIHLEADIHATKNNPNGFATGDWMPYLVVKYQLTKEGAAEKRAGDLMPMTASDGPHYGDNVKLMGPGRYKLVLHIEPPSDNPRVHFGRHVDKETGVGPWFKPFDATFEFTYAGTGKKGAY
ncbi:iron transporter [Rhodoblastus acidophilus]|uniref:Iron transporter n=1 Tax=Candidatus Rhodoblastus alkanivorans TaxID=2954117 RepID=A0ABS9Z2T4_9HYPH|nr:iron transporter [Candidatus Rhodoblastus alkanivorans]MCI4679746.1 iron transporter [Candidatus Rhodoblastus alkanivorans]MCI4681984.1 iron transporter [Candidatus Rhodoblastus alkanivorans]MDI4643035.1 iron transporter [Rhodoblastus acidophilus]